MRVLLLFFLFVILPMPTLAMTRVPQLSNVYVDPDFGSEPGAALESVKLVWHSLGIPLDIARGEREVKPGYCYALRSTSTGETLHSEVTWQKPDGTTVVKVSESRAPWLGPGFPCEGVLSGHPAK